MRRKPVALLLVGLLALMMVLAGCRRSAAPTLEPLAPEDEATAMVQEAQENTEDMVATPTTETEVAPTEEPGETGDETEPAPEPTVITEPTVAEPAVEPTATPVTVVEPTATTAAPTAEPTAVSVSGPTTYVVQPGDNLFRIALRHGLEVSTLAQANHITNPSMISVGQELIIPAEGGTTTTKPSPTPGCRQVYIVQRGDNLFRIALRYNYSQYYLAQVNDIANPSNISVGQAICIP